MAILLTSGVECSVSVACEFISFDNEYTCILKNVILNDRSEIVLIRRNHLDATFNDASVTSVSFQSSSLSHIPLEIFRVFKNLVHLDVQNSRLRTFNRLTNCGNLRTLMATDNEITEVTRESLAACTNLFLIDLHDNPITRVEDGFFNKELTNLFLCFDNCKISEIEPTFLDGVRGMSLFLSDNECINQNFTNISPSTLAGIRPAFQRCFGSINNFVTEFVECNFLRSTDGIYTCRIMNALINNENMGIHIGRRHPPGHSDDNVESVEFVGSSLSHIPVEFFSTFRNLKYLNVSNSRLQSVNTLSHCDNLEFLYAFNNEISEMRQGSLAACPNLRYISMSNNPIRRLENRFFGTATRGIDIRLDDCLINEVEPTFFANFIDIGVLSVLNNTCISAVFNNIHPTNIAGIAPFFFRCFGNFRNYNIWTSMNQIPSLDQRPLWCTFREKWICTHY